MVLAYNDVVKIIAQSSPFDFDGLNIIKSIGDNVQAVFAFQVAEHFVASFLQAGFAGRAAQKLTSEGRIKSCVGITEVSKCVRETFVSQLLLSDLPVTVLEPHFF